ncbi:MAG: hypothetical protein NT031_09605 [Planctomycetota bacterium]|nr:hypothetical protein [Planctomycetota bacterium]
MIRTMGIVILGGCLLAGCGPQTYPVAYPEAVRAVAELYPPGGTEIAGQRPAYSREMGFGQFNVNAAAKEISPGQQFRVQIEKTWEYSSTRRTSVIVQRADQGVLVTVRSEKQFLPNKDIWLRDSVYELILRNEVSGALKGSAAPAP